MTTDIAVRAIDYYFSRYDRLYSSLPFAKRQILLDRAAPGLAWYGGEPLLQFALIKRSFEHFETKPWTDEQRSRINYSLTTNFSVVSDEIVHFLTSHRVLLHVSLDGPQQENDKNRVFANGKGTFETVFENLQTLRKLAPDYFRTRVIIQSVAADNLDVSACEAFVATSGDSTNRLGLGRYRPHAVSKRGTVVADAEREYALLEATDRTDCASFAEHLRSVLDLSDFDTSRAKDLRFNGQLLQLRGFFDIATAPRRCFNARRSIMTCPMGFDQLFVSADGKFHRVWFSYWSGGPDRLAERAQG